MFAQAQHLLTHFFSHLYGLAVLYTEAPYNRLITYQHNDINCISYLGGLAWISVYIFALIE